MRSLIERQGGIASIAPSMREIPLSDNPAAFTFAERLFSGKIDVLILLTGVGTRALADVLETQYNRQSFIDALRKTFIIVRGPKPAAILREWQVKFAYQVAEPNTWRELLALLDAQVPVAGRTVAVQEYGQPNPELYSGLEERGAQLIRVPVYRWSLPVDTAPLEDAIRAIAAGEMDVLLFTSAYQAHNVLAVAERLGLKEELLAAAQQCVIASIGPTASEALENLGLSVDIQPEHPKMGHLVIAAARESAAKLAAKRQGRNDE